MTFITIKNFISKKIRLILIGYIIIISLIQTLVQYIYYSNFESLKVVKIIEGFVGLTKISLLLILIYFIVEAIANTVGKSVGYKLSIGLILILWFLIIPIYSFVAYFGLGDSGSIFSVSALLSYLFLDLIDFLLLPVVLTYADYF